MVSLRRSSTTAISFHDTHTPAGLVRPKSITIILRHANGVIGGKGGAAEILGMPSSTLRSRVKKLGIK